MQIVILDCENQLRNYAFIIIDLLTKQCALIDTLASNTLVDYLKTHHLHLRYILNTHHHHDHVGGNLYFKSIYNCDIYGHSKDAQRIKGITHEVLDGDIISLFDDQLRFQVISIDGHTIGHIAYFEANKKWLFPGDTLFNLGCGKRFEGTNAQYATTMDKLAALPDDTIVYGTHEYTLGNAKFAKSIIPENYPYYHEFLEFCQQQKDKRANGQPTIPFTLKSQKLFNPFMLCHDPHMQQSLEMQNCASSDIFGAIRDLKDAF